MPTCTSASRRPDAPRGPASEWPPRDRLGRAGTKSGIRIVLPSVRADPLLKPGQKPSIHFIPGADRHHVEELAEAIEEAATGLNATPAQPLLPVEQLPTA